MNKQYITVTNTRIVTQSADLAKEVLAIVKGAGYKRSTVSNFSDIYTQSYASTSPKEKRVVNVQYAPESSDNKLILSDDIILILLASGWYTHQHVSLTPDSVTLCRDVEVHVEEAGEEQAEDIKEDTQQALDLY
jgi:hypothetical protein